MDDKAFQALPCRFPRKRTLPFHECCRSGRDPRGQDIHRNKVLTREPEKGPHACRLSCQPGNGSLPDGPGSDGERDLRTPASAISRSWKMRTIRLLCMDQYRTGGNADRCDLRAGEHCEQRLSGAGGRWLRSMLRGRTIRCIFAAAIYASVVVGSMGKYPSY